MTYTYIHVLVLRVRHRTVRIHRTGVHRMHTQLHTRRRMKVGAVVDSPYNSTTVLQYKYFVRGTRSTKLTDNDNTLKPITQLHNSEHVDPRHPHRFL